MVAQKGALSTKTHLASTSARYTKIFRLSAGNKHDTPKGRKLIECFYSEHSHYPLMDRVYKDYETRKLAAKQGFIPVVLHKCNRRKPWNMIKNFINDAMSLNAFFADKML